MGWNNASYHFKWWDLIGWSPEEGCYGISYVLQGIKTMHWNFWWSSNIKIINSIDSLKGSSDTALVLKRCTKHTHVQEIMLQTFMQTLLHEWSATKFPLSLPSTYTYLFYAATVLPCTVAWVSRWCAWHCHVHPKAFTFTHSEVEEGRREGGREKKTTVTKKRSNLTENTWM